MLSILIVWPSCSATLSCWTQRRCWVNLPSIPPCLASPCLILKTTNPSPNSTFLPIQDILNSPNICVFDVSRSRPSLPLAVASRPISCGWKLFIDRNKGSLEPHHDYEWHVPEFQHDSWYLRFFNRVITCNYKSELGWNCQSLTLASPPNKGVKRCSLLLVHDCLS